MLFSFIIFTTYIVRNLFYLLPGPLSRVKVEINDIQWHEIKLFGIDCDVCAKTEIEHIYSPHIHHA